MGLSKLEAVNIILDGIGETPVSSLDSGLPDAEAAETKLNEIHTTKADRFFVVKVFENTKIVEASL